MLSLSWDWLVCFKELFKLREFIFEVDFNRFELKFLWRLIGLIYWRGK